MTPTSRRLQLLTESVTRGMKEFANRCDAARYPSPWSIPVRGFGGLAFGLLPVLVVLVAGSGCRSRAPQGLGTGLGPGSGPADWQAWRVQRHESIAGPHGWITLVGRLWLEEGVNTAGSDPTNHAVFPAGRAPAHAGVFVRRGGAVRFEAAPGVVASVDGEVIRAVDLVSDAPGPATRLQLGELTVNVIERGERGEKIGLRLRDPGTPARAGFAGLECFPYDPAWRIEGRFELYPEPRTLRVNDVTGSRQALKSPGEIVFRAAGGEHRLQTVEEPGDDRLFVMFRDRTAGRSTYGAGRFLYVDRPAPGEGNRVMIDFNRAYTPPCGFTAYATCPLAPPGNRLPFGIRAGERAPAGHHP